MYQRARLSKSDRENQDLQESNDRRDTAPSSMPGLSLSGGQALAAEARAVMEPSFGFDFSQVRIHTGPEADHASRALDANAFCVGDEIAFADGRFDPAGAEGRTLLAHELAHVVQNRRFGPSQSGVSRRGDSAEREANDAARTAAAGGPASVNSAPGAAIAREEAGQTKEEGFPLSATTPWIDQGASFGL